MMYHNNNNSVCRGPILRQRRPPRVVCHGQHHCAGSRRHIHQRSSKFDPLSLYGGLHGLSFDPFNTQALRSAVTALRSTQCSSIQTPPGDSPCQAPSFSNPCSSNNSDTNSFTRASTPPERQIHDPPPACPGHAHGHAPVQSMPAPVAAGLCDSSGSPTPVDVIPSQQEKSRNLFSREEFLRERVVQDKLLEKTSCLLQLQKASHRSCPKKELKSEIIAGVQVGVGTNKSSTKSRKRRKDLTWIDWGWPGTHVACPFKQQRHLELDDSLVRPERVGHVILHHVPQEK